MRAIQYAQSLSPKAKAVCIELDTERARRLEERRGRWGMGVLLVGSIRRIARSSDRSSTTSTTSRKATMITIILPEFVPARRWQQILHKQTALLVKGALLFRRNVVVTDVPYLLKR